MILHKSILLSILTFVFSLSSFCQTQSEQVNLIRKAYYAINSNKTLKKVTLKNEEFLENVTDSGAELCGFYKSGQIQKIKQWVGLSNGIQTIDFYFKSGELIFVYKTYSSFVYDNEKQELDYSKTENLLKCRYYFKNKKLIYHIVAGENQANESTKESEEGLLKAAANNLKMLNKKNSSVR